VRKLNATIIGHDFTGKAHAHAGRNDPPFFDLAAEPVFKVTVGHGQERLRTCGDDRGREETTVDWREMVNRDDADLERSLVSEYESVSAYVYHFNPERPSLRAGAA
jgi:hypothetical protein